jgi:hypothetical protein
MDSGYVCGNTKLEKFKQRKKVTTREDWGFVVDF